MALKRWNEVRTAAVIGSGVMGAAIAAHLANAGIRCLLLDVVPNSITVEEELKGLTLTDKAVRNRLAAQGIRRLKQTKPSPLYMEAFADRITAGNTEDDMTRLRSVDWIIEAVTERLDIKRVVWDEIEAHWTPGTLVSSNTSGISLTAIAQGRAQAFKESFVGTHFFNPPRYMHLVEVIPTVDSAHDTVEQAREWCERRLGKGVVIAKDTPNFIANRIGTYSLVTTLQEMERAGLTIEEVDAITGPAMGRPKSATFRTLDLVGLDTFMHVVGNLTEHAPTEAERQLFRLPNWYHKLVEQGHIGEKAGQGFYKKEGKGRITALRFDTMQYVDRQPVQAASLEAVKRAKGTGNKLHALLNAKDKHGTFAWDTTKQMLAYSASLVGVIADDIQDIDQAMRWGFNWQLGPFEMWDAIGVKESTARMQAEGIDVPAWVLEWLAAGHDTFYRKQANGGISYAHLGTYRDVVTSPQHISLRELKEAGATIESNAGASLIDLGDGVACLEFHSPNNAIGGDILSMIQRSVALVEQQYRGLVVANEGKHFCVGANIMQLLAEAQAEEWEEIDDIIKHFQQSMLRLKRLQKPVVAAPHQMTLGGGVEACLPADVILFSAETYYGLVETGVGLIPAGGGCKELLQQLSAKFSHADDDLTPHVLRIFETIAMAKVSTSGFDTERLGYRRPKDEVLIDSKRRIYEAKQMVLALDAAGFSSEPSSVIRVAGREAKAAMKLAIQGMREGGYISEHDALIANKLAHILAGGDVPSGALVSEQYVLDLEREAFLSLCGEQKTQQRMEHMLRTGKPLRN
ncbi:3-hydroxyacyl-CoA dehydrogenase/enoyl-CoA hydratase family protein [Paenibacillus taiwanensis]|uniref:3-hydroxyacyl-CoA dehydrogenase/enoyl-CoA hydratase family protein n=1 Tax=Paenibacillus taiwanensis TaxID=401638 RepID=UPI0004272B04|nr:3-hydroxyacyl-CoA dehydrogenase/enoyl-CoA hydratase family protein [Paenibacillus taiwanensis]